MKRDNPFTLSFGRQPGEYISRYHDTEEVISTFDAEQPVSQAFLIEGVRGSGKTVLMTTIVKEFESREEWMVVELNSSRNLMEELGIRITAEMNRQPELLKRGFGITAAGFGVTVNGQNVREQDVLIVEDGMKALKKANRRLLVTIDEVMADENMRIFASQFQIWIRQEYPVFLLMTGLYDSIYAIQNDPALTFLLRTPKIRLEPLSIHQMTKQYQKVFDIETSLAGQLARITKGYAFAFQALGLLYYEYAGEMPLEQIVLKLDDMLDDYVYRKIWESLSSLDRDVLRCMSENEIRGKDICDKIGMTAGTFSKYRDRLIKKGLITSTRHGYVTLVLPRFSVVIASYE